MFKRMIVLVVGIFLLGLSGCHIKTPEIHGIVLDEETKQPVPEAWVTATLGIRSKTVAGDVSKYLSVENPHTRTDRSGKFLILPKKFKKSSFPVGFGTDVESFGVGVGTMDDRGGSIDLMKDIGKKKIEVTIYIKPEERTEGEYFAHLQALFNYCLTGRFSVEVPPVEGGCDEWELNYAIAKHERFIDRLGDPKTMDQRIHYAGTMKQSAYLYKRKGDYAKALETFKKVKTFEEKRGVDLWLREFEHQIQELQKKLEGVKK